LLIIPLLVVAKERGESVFAILGMGRSGPQPQHTISTPDFISGSGSKTNPYLLQTIESLSPGKTVSSQESITISHLLPEAIVRFMDMNAETNEGRFNMADIVVEAENEDKDEKGTGSISFKLKFEDIYDSNDGEEFTTLMRVGNSTVYFQWTVSIEDSSGGKKKRKVTKKDDSSLEKAKSEAAAAKKKEIEVKKKAEEDARERIEAESRIQKAEEEARKKAEAEVRQEAEAESRIQKAEEEARKKAEAEVRQEAEVEARIKKAEDEVRRNAEDEAATKLAKMEAMMTEKMGALEDKMDDLSSKEAELARVAANTSLVDFNTLGTATMEEKDDLQRVNGIGTFIEEKLNVLGIFTFRQIANMTPEIEEQVNAAIEFFSGRIKRDNWVKQAKEILKQD
jgi:predicted flap endonuclease-1-like 5' DNA nuclease